MKVWVLFSNVGNPGKYTFHGVYDNQQSLEENKRLLSGGIRVIETTLNIFRDMHL